jgi:hypothetical protein
MAFWRMLKKGNDHFEVTHLEPKVNVCEKRYVFDAEPRAGSTRALSFSPAGHCPAFEVAEDVATAVREKQQRDDVQVAELTRRGTPVAPVHTDIDGGMHPVFVAAVKKNQLGVAPQEALFVTTPPGTIPATVRPPRIPELAGAVAMENVPAAPAAKPEPATRMAIAEPEAAAKPASKSSSFFGSLFSSKSEKPAEAPAEQTAEKKHPLLDRMARIVGLRKTDTAHTDAAKPKPPTRVASHGAIKPKSAESRTVEAAPPAAKPGAVQPQTDAKGPAQQAPASTAMNGAAPVVPAGGFDSRWSGLR